MKTTLTIRLDEETDNLLKRAGGKSLPEVRLGQVAGLQGCGFAPERVYSSSSQQE